MKQTFYPDPNISFPSNDPPNTQQEQPQNFFSEEQEELLIKIYEENITLISTISKIMQISEICTFLFFLLFLILLSINESPKGPFNLFYINIPCFISIITALISINMFLYLKDLFDISNMHSTSNPKHIQKSSLFLLILSNFIGILLLVFVILVSLRSNKTIVPNDLNVIFIPLYLAFIMLFTFAVFFTPAFIYGALYLEMALIFISLLSAIVFCILLCVKENREITQMKYAHVFIPIYFVLGAFLLFLGIGSLIENSGTKESKGSVNKNISNVILGIGGVFILSAVIALQVKLDNEGDDKYYYIEIIIGMIGYVFICANHLYNMFCEPNLENEKND